MIHNDWADVEFNGIDLGDKRLGDRLKRIVNDFISSTQSPINKVSGNWAGTKAAYRFFQNEKIDYTDIISHHAKSTNIRSSNESVILALQDTTYFNYTDHPNTEGLGLLSRFTGKHKADILTKGIYMHCTLAVNTDGIPLGLLDQKITAREVLSKEKTALKKRSHNTALPIEEKESIRWLDSMRVATSIFSNKTDRLVTVADREADIYDLFLLAQKLNTNFLIRASKNRKINKTAVHSENSGELIWDFMKSQNKLGSIQIELPKKENHPARKANCDLKISKITVLPPRHFKGDKSQKLGLDLFAIQVVETGPPKGVEKIDWTLYTNLPVNNFQEAVEKVKWYCLRWRIEVYFKVIKSGFQVERCRLETADRLVRYLAVISVVAWRVFWLTMVPRTSPNICATEFLTESEWKVLFTKFNPNRKVPEKPPSIKHIVIWIAQLGGYLARAGDGSPGVTHIWRGIEKLSDMVLGLSLHDRIYG